MSTAGHDRPMLASPAMRVAQELWSPLGAALALTAAVLFFGGHTLPWIGGAAVLVAAVLVAARGIAPGAWFVLPLVALAVWCAVSIAWSIEPDRTWDYADRTAVYAVFAFIGTFLAGRTRGLATGFAALLGAVCVWSLAGKVFPFLYEDYGRISRLRGPVGYWNALALLGDFAIPLGLWLASRRRVPGVLLVYGWSIAIALTYSRGGILVALLVAAAWLLLSGLWLQGLATLVAACVPAAAVIGIAFTLNGITSDGSSHATRVRDGLLFGAALVVGAVVAAVLSRIPPPEPVPMVRRMAAVLAIVLAAAVCLIGGFHAKAWWDQFTAPASSELGNGPGRIAEANSNHRWIWWKQAWDGFQGHELAGTGAGSFAFTNLRYRTTDLDTTTEPHDLPLQFLSETGVIGLALFLLVGFAFIRGVRSPTDPELALSLVLPAFLFHGLLDIDWDFAAVAAPAFLVAGALVSRPIPRPSFSFSRALVAAGVALLLLSSMGAIWLGGRWTGEAENELVSNPAHAAALAKKARSVQPLSIDPLTNEALAEEVQRHYGAALGLFQRATRLQPENAEAWFDLGLFNLDTRHCPQAAYAAFNRVTTLSPQDRLGSTYYAQTLKLVNSGKAVC